MPPGGVLDTSNDEPSSCVHAMDHPGSTSPTYMGTALGMRLLHTSDWHLLKPIARRDRTDEYRAVLDEVVAIAEDEGVDLVVHSGDLFDRAIPSPEAIHLALSTLVRLTDGGRRPVVVVAGNHDSPRLFEALAPVLLPLGVHLVGDARPPGQGGTLEFTTPGGEVVVSCIPYVPQGKVVDFMDEPGKAHATFAQRMQAIVEAHRTHVRSRAGNAVTILASHFTLDGVKVQGGQGPTGMKELTLGKVFAVTPAAVNHDFSYVALGHIHLPQDIPGPGAGAYAGSLLQLDFGEAGEEKRVLVVEAEPGRPASVRSVPLASGRKLRRAEGTWEDLVDRTDLDESWLDLTIHTTGPPGPEVVDEWSRRFGRAVKIRAEYPTEAGDDQVRISGRSIDDLYAEYHRLTYGEPEEELITLVGDVWEEAER